MPDQTAAPGMETQGLFPGTEERHSVARLYGHSMEALPKDLFIPPDALEIFLEAFEGPLDLLLYLIRRQNFNILDIPMAALTAQYLQYIERIRRRKVELAAEYLLMAAMLVEIKSRMLLPRPKPDTGDEPEDPRAELVQKLLQYERMKRAAARLDELPVIERDFFTPCADVIFSSEKILPAVTAESLQMALLDMIDRAKLTERHVITRQALSVREHMTAILRRLADGKFAEFSSLFDVSEGPASIIVLFLALLELAKESLVQITQEDRDAPIFVRLSA